MLLRVILGNCEIDKTQQAAVTHISFTIAGSSKWMCTDMWSTGVSNVTSWGLTWKDF